MSYLAEAYEEIEGRWGHLPDASDDEAYLPRHQYFSPPHEAAAALQAILVTAGARS